MLDNRVPEVYEGDKCPYPYRWALEQVAGTDAYLPIAVA